MFFSQKFIRCQSRKDIYKDSFFLKTITGWNSPTKELILYTIRRLLSKSSKSIFHVMIGSIKIWILTFPGGFAEMS